MYVCIYIYNSDDNLGNMGPIYYCAATNTGTCVAGLTVSSSYLFIYLFRAMLILYFLQFSCLMILQKKVHGCSYCARTHPRLTYTVILV